MRVLSTVAISLLLGACASTQNVAVAPSVLDTMDGQSVVLIQRETPSFVAMTSGKGMFAVAGVGAAVAAGNKMVSENGISDPAMTISRSLAEGLARDYGVQVQGETGLAASDTVDSIVELAAGSDYALDVATQGWSYIYDGFSFGDYFVGYSSKVRLIKVSTAEIVSSGMCAYDAKKLGKAPVSHDKLLAEDAAFIKQELSDATNLCVRELAANLFSISPESVAQNEY